MEGVQHENVEDAGTAEENPEPQSSPEVHDAVANADMLREVFKNLDTLEISRATCVCRTWRAVADSPQFWESLVCLDRQLTYDQAVRIIRRHCLSLRVMRLAGKAVPAVLFENPTFKILLTRLVRLTELNLSHLTLSEQALTALSGPAAVPSLKILVLDDVALTGTGDVTLSHPAVETAQLTNCRLGRVTLECGKLRSLSLAKSHITTLACQACPQLKELNLRALCKIRDTDLRAALTRLTSLTSLHLDEVACLVEDTLREAIPVMEHLEFLSLAGCGSSITLAAFRGAAALRVLHLEGCEGISGPTLQPALASCGSMQELWLDKCSHLTSLHLEGHPSLRFISARGCRLLASVEVKCKRVTQLLVGPRELGGAGCPALKTIILASDDVESITWSSLPSLEAVQLDCPNLSYLAFIDCDSLTDAAISGLSDSLSQPPTITLASVPPTSSARASIVGSSTGSTPGPPAAPGNASGAGIGGSGAGHARAPRLGPAAGRTAMASGSGTSGGAGGSGSGSGAGGGSSARAVMPPGASRGGSRGRGRGSLPPLGGPPVAGAVGEPVHAGAAQASTQQAGIFGVPPVRIPRGGTVAAGGGRAAPASAPAVAGTSVASPQVMRAQPAPQVAIPGTAPAGNRAGLSAVVQQVPPIPPPGSSRAASDSAAGGSRQHPPLGRLRPSDARHGRVPDTAGENADAASEGGRSSCGRGQLRSRSWGPHQRRAPRPHSVHSCSSTSSSDDEEDPDEGGPSDMGPPPSKHQRVGHQRDERRRRPSNSGRQQQQPRSWAHSQDAAGPSNSGGQAQPPGSLAGRGLLPACSIRLAAMSGSIAELSDGSTAAPAAAVAAGFASAAAPPSEVADEMVIDAPGQPVTSAMPASHFSSQGALVAPEVPLQPIADNEECIVPRCFEDPEEAGQPSFLRAASGPSSPSPELTVTGACWKGLSWLMRSPARVPPPKSASPAPMQAERADAGARVAGAQGQGGGSAAAPRGAGALGSGVSASQPGRLRQQRPGVEGEDDAGGGSFRGWHTGRWRRRQLQRQQEEAEREEEEEGLGMSLSAQYQATERITARLGRLGRHRQAQSPGSGGQGQPQPMPPLSLGPAPPPPQASSPSQAAADQGQAAAMDVDTMSLEGCPSLGNLDMDLLEAAQQLEEMSNAAPEGTTGGVPFVAEECGTSRAGRPRSPASAGTQPTTLRPASATRTTSGGEGRQEVRAGGQMGPEGSAAAPGGVSLGTLLGSAIAGGLAAASVNIQALIGPSSAAAAGGGMRAAGPGAEAGSGSRHGGARVQGLLPASGPARRALSDQRVADVISLVSSRLMQRGQGSGAAAGAARADGPQQQQQQQQGRRPSPGLSSAPAPLSGSAGGTAGPSGSRAGAQPGPGAPWGRGPASLHRHQPPSQAPRQQPAGPAAHALMDLEASAQFLDMEDDDMAPFAAPLLDEEPHWTSAAPAPAAPASVSGSGVATGGGRQTRDAGTQHGGAGAGAAGAMAAAPAALAVVMRHPAFHAVAAGAVAAATAPQAAHTQVAYTPVHGVPRLRTLLIEGCESLAHVSLRHSALTRLTLSGCRRVTQLALHCPWLYGLVLEECGALKVASLGPVGIDKLSLGTCSALCHVAVSSPALRSLDLRGCGQLDSLALEGCSNLEVLDATFCSGLKEPALVAALRPSPPLTKLVLSAVAQLGSPHLGFLSGLTRLRVLDLSYSDVTDLSALPSLVPRLEVLTLASCHSLHHTSLLSLLPSAHEQQQQPPPDSTSAKAVADGPQSSGLVAGDTAGAQNAAAGAGTEGSGPVGAGLACLTELDVSYCALDPDTVAALLLRGTQLKSLALDGCAGVTSALWPALHRESVAAAQAGTPWQPALQTLSLKSCKALRALCLGLQPANGPLKVYEPKQYPYLRPEAVAAEVAATEWQPLELPGAVNMEGVTAAGAAVAESPASSPGGAPVLPSLQVLRLGLSGLQVLALSLPSLTTLELNGCGYLRALELRCPRLQSFRSSWAPEAAADATTSPTEGNSPAKTCSYAWPAWMPNTVFRV